MRLLAFQYHSRPQYGDYHLPIRGTFTRFLPGSKYARFRPGSKVRNEGSVDDNNADPPYTVSPPKAPSRRPTPSLLTLMAKGEGGICVFLSFFVIDGSLTIDVNNKGWTEAWETPSRRRDLWRSPRHIGPSLLCPLVQISSGTTKKAPPWFPIS